MTRFKRHTWKISFVQGIDPFITPEQARDSVSFKCVSTVARSVGEAEEVFRKAYMASDDIYIMNVSYMGEYIEPFE